MFRAALSRWAEKNGYVKLPPRHTWKLKAEAPLADLSEHGLAQLPHWKARRRKIVAMWDAIDAVRAGD